MLSDSEQEAMREEFETLDRWRKFSRHVVADLLEVCAVCGCIREKCRLARCRWCEDTYYCADGLCFHQHQANHHPAVANWIW
jgi:hypothetical protein